MSGVCDSCDASKGHAPTIIFASVIFVLFGVAGAIAYTQKQRVINSVFYQTARYFLRVGKVKIRLVFFSAQVLSEFSLIAQKTNAGDGGGNGGFMEPAATFARSLGVANFDVLGFLPMNCVLPESSFYTKLLIKTVAPIVPLALLWSRPLAYTFTGAHETRRLASLHLAAKMSLVWLELILPSVSTTIIETFVCSEFDDDMFYLNAQLTIPCNGSSRRVMWLALAGFAVAIYPVGTSRYRFSMLWCLGTETTPRRVLVNRRRPIADILSHLQQPQSN